MRSRRGLALLSLGLVVLAFLASPSGAHVGTMKHLWTKHMKPLAVKVFYTKKQSNARYYTKAAANSRFYTKSTADARYYTTGAADARFALKGETADGGLEAYCSRAEASPSSYPPEICTAPLLFAVDAGGDVGEFTSLAIGIDGLPVVSYHDVTNGDLKVAHCGNQTCTSGNQTTTVDTGGASDVGEHTSIAVGADGLPVVAYYDATSLDLKILHCGNLFCSAGNVATVVDALANVGTDTSVAIGLDGLPVVSYVDVTNADLKVLHCGNAACTSGNQTNAPDAGPVGSATDTSIAIGADGLPVISYWDGDDADLLLMHCGDAGCSAGNVAIALDSSGSVGDFSSLAVGTDGNPVISYRDGTTGNLKVVHCGDGTCSTGNVVTPVDTAAGPLGYDTSIAIDGEGLPVVSYWNSAANDLKLVRCGNAACSAGNEVLTLDSAGAVGRHTSVALGADGLPIVTYYDASNGDLKVARPPVS
jgi:hypothetical protein